MKKFVFLIPIAIFLLFTTLGSRLFASGQISPATLVIATAVIMLVMALVRPKTGKQKPVSGVEELVRGEFARDAFADAPDRNAKFQAIVKDYSGNMPKSALGKIAKLQPLCQTDEERYALARISALVHSTLGKFPEAVRQYTTALVLCPSSDLALELGSCQQRLGQLKKARESYQYAMDLDEGNLEAQSKLATAYVADRMYDEALDQAMEVLNKEPRHASSLATAAICYGMLGETVLYKRYTDLAVEAGYKKDKITDTVTALKK